MRTPVIGVIQGVGKTMDRRPPGIVFGEIHLLDAPDVIGQRRAHVHEQVRIDHVLGIERAQVRFGSDAEDARQAHVPRNCFAFDEDTFAARGAADETNALSRLPDRASHAIPTGDLHRCRNLDADILRAKALVDSVAYFVSRDDDLKHDRELMVRLEERRVTLLSVA